MIEQNGVRRAGNSPDSAADRLFRGGRLCRMVARAALCSFLFTVFLDATVPAPSYAQVSVGISVTIPPPALPVYVQPPCPGPGYIWTPGYWAWDPDYGYYWVPGTWVLIPNPGWLWTPGYWGWANGVYLWYEGYWGPVVGFYGGINYGFGYNGYGYYGGYWNRGRFYYNRAVNNVRGNIPYVYSRPVPRSPTRARVSFNGGRGGVNLRPTRSQLEGARRRESPPVAAQREHLQGARHDPALRARNNEGRPAVAATPRPGAFHDPGAVGASRGGASVRETPAPRGGHQGTRERALPPAAPGTHERVRELRHEAPAPPPTHRAVPRGGESPPYRAPVEPPRHGQAPQPGMVHPRMEPAPAREIPRMTPPAAPRAEPRGQMAPRMPGGGERREEGGHR